MFMDFLARNSVSFSLAFLTAFVLMMTFGKLFIPMMKTMQKRGAQPIRSDGIKAHLDEKKGTPTMGGILLIPAIVISSMIFMDWSSLIPWIPLAALVAFGILGAIDDYNKMVRGNSYAGLSKVGRLISEGFIAVVLSFMIDAVQPANIPDLSIFIPSGIVLSVGMFYFVWSYFVIVGTANAANLTDGLDGMLSKILLVVMTVMIIALVGITRIDFMPNLVYLPETAALFPVFGASLGAILGYLWFNSKPASIFMGDVGSLGLGGLLGSSALIMKSEIVMAVAGFIMILVVISSFVQMMFYKFFARPGRSAPFLMAPLHHHYEKKGVPETKISERFFIATIIFAGIAVAMLKL